MSAVEGLRMKNPISAFEKKKQELEDIKNNSSDFAWTVGEGQIKANTLKRLEREMYKNFPTKYRETPITRAPEVGETFAPGVGECPVGKLPENPTPEDLSMQNVKDIQRTVLAKAAFRGISLVAFTGGVTEYPGNRIDSEGHRSVIVNAANRGAQEGSGVAGDIYDAGAPRQQKAERTAWTTEDKETKVGGENCKPEWKSRIPCIPTGHARITSGINTWTKKWTGKYDDKTKRRVTEMEVHPDKMQVQHVIHTVGPDFREQIENPSYTVEKGLKDLKSAYKSSLDLAMGYHMGLIGFPLISAGVFRSRFFKYKDGSPKIRKEDREAFEEQRGRELDDEDLKPVPLEEVVRAGLQAVKEWIRWNSIRGTGSVQEIAFFAFAEPEQEVLTNVFNEVFAEI
jgi:O-acetyl-ADP-ribose deacetylase (regulator of RNase III)